MDAYIGGLSENHAPNSTLGDLFKASITEQFGRLRDGDRFYFENIDNGLFTNAEISTINQTSLRDIILRNTDIQALPENIYIKNVTHPWPMAENKPQPSPIDAMSPSPVEQSSEAPVAAKATEVLVPSIYTLEWQLETIDDVEYMRFTILCATTGWVGLGFARDASSAMVEADIVVAKVEDGVASVEDYWATSFSEPQTDTSLGGSRDIELIEGSETDGTTRIVFRKKLMAEDSYDRSISKTEPVPIIYAWHGTSDALQYHSVARQGKAVLDLYGRLPSLASSPSPSSSEQQQITQTSFGGSIPVDASSNLSLEWNIVDQLHTHWLNATIRMKTTGLSAIALGFEGPDGGLNGADVIKVESSGLYCAIRDSWAMDANTINYDYAFGSNDDLSQVNCRNLTDGYIEASFMRLVDTRDPSDQPVVENGLTDIFFLWDRFDTEIHPGTFQSKRFKVDFFAMQGSPAWQESENFFMAGDAPGPASSTPPESTSPALPSPEMEGLNFHGEVTLDRDAGYHLLYATHDQDITIQLTLMGSGFAGVGLPGADRNMHSADLIIAVSDGEGGCQVQDYWSDTFAKPRLDIELGGTNDLTETSCIIQDGYLNATFTRPYVPEDLYDRNLALDSSVATIIYAFHPSSDGLVYHGATRRGVIDINLIQPSAGSQELLSTEFDDEAMKELTDGYKIWWKVVRAAPASRRRAARKLMDDEAPDDESEVIIKLQRKSTGWMGFGIEPADISVNGMQDTDMYIAWIDPDSTVHIMDAWSVGFMPPEFDTQQGGEDSILAYAGEERDGESTVVFKRRVNTGDPFDRVIKNSNQDIVFAYGEGDGLPAGGHGPCCRGKDSINWYTTRQSSAEQHRSAATNEQLKSAHAWLMTLGWALFGIMGLMVSHIGRHWKHWKLMHIALEITAVVLSSLGEIIALSYTNGKIRGAHGVLSFFLVFTMVPQVFLGFYAKKTDSYHWIRLHRGMGYFVIGIVCWQMWLGMQLFGTDKRLVQCFYAWLISVGVAFHFAADNVSIFDLKTHLTKKGFNVDEASSTKQGRKSSKAKSTAKEGGLPEKQTTKQQDSDAKGLGSFSIKASKDHSKPAASNKNAKTPPASKGDLQKMEAQAFMESCANGKHLTVIDNKVYDMSRLINTHPGGPDQVLDIIGKDGTEVYYSQHASSEAAHSMLHKHLLAELIESTD